MVTDLVGNYEPVKGSEVLFPSGREVIGKCPRCGGNVTESRKGYFCESNDCRFGLWRGNKFLTSKKIALTGKMVSSLLKDGRTYVCGTYSERTGKNYDAFIRLEDDGGRVVAIAMMPAVPNIKDGRSIPIDHLLFVLLIQTAR